MYDCYIVLHIWPSLRSWVVFKQVERSKKVGKAGVSLQSSCLCSPNQKSEPATYAGYIWPNTFIDPSAPSINLACSAKWFVVTNWCLREGSVHEMVCFLNQFMDVTITLDLFLSTGAFRKWDERYLGRWDGSWKNITVHIIAGPLGWNGGPRTISCCCSPLHSS